MCNEKTIQACCSFIVSQNREVGKLCSLLYLNKYALLLSLSSFPWPKSYETYCAFSPFDQRLLDNTFATVFEKQLNYVRKSGTNFSKVSFFKQPIFIALLTRNILCEWLISHLLKRLTKKDRHMQ